jgi:hypothetical protein
MMKQMNVKDLGNMYPKALINWMEKAEAFVKI